MRVTWYGLKPASGLSRYESWLCVDIADPGLVVGRNSSELLDGSI